MNIRKLLFAIMLISSLFSVYGFVGAQDTTITGFGDGTLGKVNANGIEIVYESFGSEDDETMLLINGTGAQLIDWPKELIDDLVGRGYRVIVFDNRDVGLSTRFDEAGPPDWVAIFTAMGEGQSSPVAYTAEDMAQDAVGLLDALDIDKVHLVGVSGGAIISQVIAANHPERTLSLTLLMSNSGNPAYPIPADPERLAAILPALPVGSPLEDIVEQRLSAAQALQSPDYPTDESVLRVWITSAVERAYYPVGSDRQGAAVLAVLGDMRGILENIQAPTVVIHGSSDPLNPYQLGEDVANTIPGADFILIEGMGHDLPVELIPTIADAIIKVATAD